MFPTKHCFEKYNIKSRSPCSIKRYDWPILRHLCLNTGVTSTVHVIFFEYRVINAVLARAHVRTLMTRKSCALRMRNVILRNHLKLSSSTVFPQTPKDLFYTKTTANNLEVNTIFNEVMSLAYTKPALNEALNPL